MEGDGENVEAVARELLHITITTISSCKKEHNTSTFRAGGKGAAGAAMAVPVFSDRVSVQNRLNI